MTTKKYGDYGTGPQEARPLTWVELTQAERELLGNIHARLNELSAKVAGEIESRSEEPWAQMEQDPRGRVMAIDGSRGSGKTTLLTTLLDQLGRARLGLADEPISLAKRVRALKILDFDPLPNGLPLHAWLIQAWLPLVEHLEKHARSSGAAGSCDDPSVIGQAELRKHWDDLFDQAVIGWSDVHDGRPVIDRLFDHREQLRDYQNLCASWSRFVDEVFNRLRCLAQPFDRDVALILVPIDDLDLQVRRNPELIHAMRLLRHRRVVYLITGHLDHTAEVLRLDYQRQHREAAGLKATLFEGKPLEDAEDSFCRSWCTDIASALVDKAFPATYRFKTSPVPISVLLRLSDGELRKLLDDLKVGDEHVGQWLLSRSDGPTGSDEALLKWRGVQRIFDKLPLLGTPKDRAAHVLWALLAQGDALDKVHIISGHHGAVIDYDLAGDLLVSVVPGWFTGVPNQRIVVGTELASARLIGPNNRRLNAPSALLARELHEAPEDPNKGTTKDGTGRRGPVKADRILLDVATVLVWTRWTNAPRHAIFLWPFARYPKMSQLRSWLSKWDDVTTKIRDSRDPAEKLAYAWIHSQLAWSNMMVPQVPDWSEPIAESAWNSLLDAAASAAASNVEQDHRDFGYWYGRSLPLFATPEIALPEAVQDRILRTVAKSVVDANSTDRVRDWVESFDGERHQAVVNAMYNAYQEDFEGTAPTDDEAEKLLRDVDKIYPESPWNKMRMKRP